MALLAAALLPIASVVATPAEPAFMAYLCGKWTGSGIADGVAVTEQLDVAWSANRRSLVATTRATSGDNFVATTELTYSPGDGGRFTAIEKNNGRWPKRRFEGELAGESLHLYESNTPRKVRLSLTRLSDGALVIQESRGHGTGWEAPFVSIKYLKAGSEVRCAA